MTKSSGYTRDLSDNEIKVLRERYIRHMKRSRSGFLSTDVRKRLLRYTNWPEDTTPQDISQNFYDIREHAKAAIDDFRLLSDVLVESEFQKIFGEKIEGGTTIEEINDQIYTTREASKYPISLFFETLVPKPKIISLRTGAVKILPEALWRKEVLEEITLKALEWYLYSGLITTEIHKRMMHDVIDVIGEVSSHKRSSYFQQHAEHIIK